MEINVHGVRFAASDKSILGLRVESNLQIGFTLTLSVRPLRSLPMINRDHSR